MKNLVPMIILILLYLACSSRSCTEDDSPRDQYYLNRILAMQDTVFQQFGKEQLSETDLRLFEEAAIQKLADWADYIRISSEDTLGDIFREQAGRMARKQFLSEKVAMQMEDSIQDSGLWLPDSIRTARLLRRVNDSLYWGSLSYIRVCPGQPAYGSSPDVHFIRISAIRAEKVFGTDRVKIWEVFLGYD